MAEDSAAAARPATVPLAARLLLLVIALFYLYGAAVHVANMLSLTGFHWPQAPLKWRILDLVYLVADIVVAVGLALLKRPAVIAFYLAATSQVLLYTLLRPWILEVPAAYRPPASAQGYLDGLVIFHLLTLVLVSALLLQRRRRAPGQAASGGGNAS